MKPSYEVRFGNKQPTMDKLMQLIGIVSLFLVGLSGSAYIIRKKCAWLLLSGYFNKVGYVNREEV
jgi:hypothetical protein